MKFINDANYQTGIAVHLTSIPGTSSAGCGEFEDLIMLGEWCKATGLSIIQILPVHDTGENPSPYSAVNAFALNPVYIRLKLIKGFEPFTPEILEFTKQSTGDQIKYIDTYRFKTHILRKIYHSRINEIQQDAGLLDWIQNNDWIKYYAGYKILARINDTPVWKTWKLDPVFASKNVKDNLEMLLQDKKEEFYFLAFVQFELDKQLQKAAHGLSKMGINLKGDLPVLMDSESSDVWYHRELFNTKFSAGAPPDQFSDNGQNWGFPVYNIDELKKTNFVWWRKRITRLDVFFHALRLDHVIGYMRIWQVNSENKNAGTGYFSPASYITPEAAETYGFSPDEVKSLATPMISAHHLREITSPEELLNLESNYLVKGIENFYELEEGFKTEKDIESLNEGRNTIDILKKIFINRSLIEVEQGIFAPKWYFNRSDFFDSMESGKKDKLGQLVHDYFVNSEEIWFENGTVFLSAINEASTFLLCGEDLGAVPVKTAELLEKLEIMSLKVLRWTRKYGEPGNPFIAPAEYPARSVATTSVHDSDNIRQWWKEDSDARSNLLPLIEPDYNPENTNDLNHEILDIDTAEKLLEWFLATSSEIVILPVQDLFSIFPDFRIDNPENERINVPGQILDSNWNYKIPVSLDSMTANTGFQQKVFEILNPRSQKKKPRTTSQVPD